MIPNCESQMVRLRSSLLSKLLEKWPGKKTFGIYRLMPLFFVVGGLIEVEFLFVVVFLFWHFDHQSYSCRLLWSIFVSATLISVRSEFLHFLFKFWLLFSYADTVYKRKHPEIIQKVSQNAGALPPIIVKENPNVNSFFVEYEAYLKSKLNSEEPIGFAKP